MSAWDESSTPYIVHEPALGVPNHCYVNILWNGSIRNIKNSINIYPENHGKFFIKECKTGITQSTLEQNKGT